MSGLPWPETPGMVERRRRRPPISVDVMPLADAYEIAVRQNLRHFDIAGPLPLLRELHAKLGEALNGTEGKSS
jgi:hypothetical protein